MTHNSLGNRLRLFASSGFVPDHERIQLAIDRLTNIGFNVENEDAAYRRFLRFAGNDADRAADLQEIAKARIETPKFLLGVRGGYGAMRILPHVDWESLGARMRERSTLMMGFSDVCALQLALLAKSGMPSFMGPMMHSEFGNPNVSEFTLRSFIAGVTSPNLRIDVESDILYSARVEGIFWGGNLSVLAALAGTPYMPDVPGGILFLEDVGEQPYRIERMLQTLYLSGVLARQQAVVLGSFRMKGIQDIYDSSYDFSVVVETLRQLIKKPVFTDFPFGHIRNKTTAPLGVPCRLEHTANGYVVTFDGSYPRLNADDFHFDRLFADHDAASILNGAIPDFFRDDDLEE